MNLFIVGVSALFTGIVIAATSTESRKNAFNIDEVIAVVMIYGGALALLVATVSWIWESL